MSDAVYKHAVEIIKQEYQRSGLQLGWRFLYSPASTLNPASRLWTIGLNPGGSEHEPPRPSVEHGNAYLVERWSNSGTLNGLQKQYAAMCEQIATRMNVGCDQLIENTVAANLVPFRTRNAKDLSSAYPNWRAFATELWADILDQVSPRVTIAFASAPFDCLLACWSKLGAEITPVSQAPVGWGKITWAYTTVTRNGVDSLLIRIPHLSRFTIFTSPKCKAAATDITTLAANAIRS